MPLGPGCGTCHMAPIREYDLSHPTTTAGSEARWSTRSISLRTRRRFGQSGTATCPRGVPPLRQLPRDVWRFSVPSLRVANLSDGERLGRIGLAPPTPGRSNWPSYQDIGDTLWREGWQGLLAPSAAHPDGLILCLFVDDLARLPADPVDPPTVIPEPPPPPTGMRT